MKKECSIPIKLFVNEKGMAKVELGLGKGKKLFDKREDLKKKMLTNKFKE